MSKIRRRKWTETEENFLLEKAGSMSRARLAVMLDRSVLAVQTKLWEIRKRGQQGHVIEPHTHSEEDNQKSLLLWFVAQAWEEGYAVVIPVLGATFQKEERREGKQQVRQAATNNL